jgi:hypothetical protein
MNRKQYIIFSLIYYPLSLVIVIAWIILSNKPGWGSSIGLFILSLSIAIRAIYGKKRLVYLGKPKWWLLFSLFPLTEPFFHIVMCMIKDKQ